MKPPFYKACTAESGAPSGAPVSPPRHFALGIEAMRARLVAGGRGQGLTKISTWDGGLGTGRIEGVACYLDGRVLYFLGRFVGSGPDGAEALEILRESEHQTR